MNVYKKNYHSVHVYIHVQYTEYSIDLGSHYVHTLDYLQILIERNSVVSKSITVVPSALVLLWSLAFDL